MAMKRIVGLIGAGNVGIAAAYAMFQRQIANEIVLVDLDRDRVEGEAMDLMHGQAYVGRVTVRAGDYEDLRDAQVVVISAGSNQRPGENRLALLDRNATIFATIADALDTYVPDAMLVVATNPVDILTHVMQKLTARPRDRVIGTGTMLDTSRFRALLGRRYGVDPRSVHAYILGEHGDSEVPIWSRATIGGRRLKNNTVLGRAFDPAAMNALFEQVRNAAQEIIAKKGFTNLAIGLVIARLVEVILSDQRSVLPVSNRLDGEYGIRDVCLSVPTIVGLDGVDSRIQLDLAQSEQDALLRSARLLRESLDAMRVPGDA